MSALLASNLGCAAFIILLAASAAGAETGAVTNGFQRQMIRLPARGGAARFADLDNDGRLDLLTVDPVAKKLLVYRQRTFGFTNAPDQVINLPPQTAWIAPFDVEVHPGVELLMSTPTGLVYCRQNKGVFETEPRTLVQAGQIFTGEDPPRLVLLATNAAIPVISATQAVLYRRIVGQASSPAGPPGVPPGESSAANNVISNAAQEWTHGPPVPLEQKRNSWSVSRSEWAMGPNAPRTLFIQQSRRSRPDDRAEEKSGPDVLRVREPEYRPVAEEKPENEGIRKLLAEMKKAGSRQESGMERVDLNGDGQKDLVVWQVLPSDLDIRTDLYVFLRGADGRLPERPAQALHCRGLPIPVRSTQEQSPVGDLKGDGTYELVLLELKSSFTSASGLLETFLSQGLQWRLTIRPFRQGAFTTTPEAAIAVTCVMPVETMASWPLFVAGDFNGDGRPDFLVRRSTTQWNIFFSTADERWFTPQPAMTFEAPMQGYFEMDDLNGDGRSDMVLRSWEDDRMFIYLSQPPRTKTKP